ncbi:thioredoxin [Aphanomyces invadans]|uniref:Thioredoxin n=1 Tax=Aphanomyces invadans TaxID=157072 RepID=A0A024U468_9STRA|nr:thioredoxin [Aphanomyces invadans]ETW01015.1 thioredoxin [Aphanomyces invadans]|eukprot:XP_008870013.1 thioredoxin [Aphanomyces invadans]
MLLRRFTAAAATSRVSIASFSSRAGASLVKELTEHAEYEQLIARPDAKSVVYFTASWCGPCKMISPVYAELSNMNTDVSFAKVDVDEMDHTAHVAGVRSMPTFQFYSNGQLQKSLGFSGADPNLLAQSVAKLKSL